MARPTSPSPAGPLGARWFRAALQVNPYAYQGPNSPSGSFTDEESYNQALVDRCQQENIEIIAVTDHWCIENSQGLIATAARGNLVALPGFEANTAEGIHVLVMFERNTPTADINGAIGACDVTPGCTSGTTGASFKDILTRMTQRDAFVIPAHANVFNSGMLTSRSGVPLQKMVQNQDLHAIAISPALPEAPDQQAILDGRPPYVRAHPLAMVYADDICRPDALAAEGATTWFKLSAPCLESIKLAVRTPATRVATADPTATPRAVIREISWEGGFLDGATIPIAPDLTAFIGGKGTGKSTTIESLRYALGISPLGEDAKRDHDGIISQALRTGTTIRVTVEAVSPMPGRYVIERTIPQPPVVRDASDSTTALRPVDVIGTVEVFGQHELAELAQDKSSVARMLERFAGHVEADEERDRILADLAENRMKLGKLEKSAAKVEDEVADIPRLQHQVDQYASSSLPQQLGEQQRMQQDQAVFAVGEERIEEARASIIELLDVELPARLGAPIEGIEGSPQEEVLRRVEATVSELSAAVTAAAESLRSSISKAASALADIRTDWNTETEPKRAGHAEVIRRLTAQGLEPSRYLATTAALEKLRAKEQGLKTTKGQLRTLQVRRNELIAELAGSDTTKAGRLRDAVRKANEATGGAVNVRPVASPDRIAIRNLVTNNVKGARTQIMAAIEATDFSPRALADAARTGVAELESKFGIRGAQATNLVAAGESLFRQLEERSIGLAADVFLDTSSTGSIREYRRLDELSKGQRATALLLLLLGASTSPLIIDQPEDDLDNRFVYNGIVQRLRSLKGSRQVIVSTHNANVPVLGDAELVIALEGDGSRGWPIRDGIGSLDDAKVRELAEDLLEGGRAAFDARQHLYGF